MSEAIKLVAQSFENDMKKKLSCYAEYLKEINR
jgi:hypothetical protein